jgi:GNAT superfamily N-acetyltransferase
VRIKKTPVAACRRFLTALHTLTFPGDVAPRWRKDGAAWLVHDEAKELVAFLYAEPLSEDIWYFSRVGVMPAARGQGLQAQLMARLEGWANRQKVQQLISTTYQNPPSANNFVRAQWMTYLPEYPWGAPDTIYWSKKLHAAK